jgi:hypothetical protein
MIYYKYRVKILGNIGRGLHLRVEYGRAIRIFGRLFRKRGERLGQRGSQFRNAKERGEWAEVRFLSRAMEQRFRVAKLWGDSAPYDLMVEQDGIAHRVQVKSTMRRPKAGAYPCPVPAEKSEEIDFVAAYIIPLDLWYIIPAGVVAMRKGSIWLAPRNRQGKYERYLEAWHFVAAVENGAVRSEGRRDRAWKPRNKRCSEG